MKLTLEERPGESEEKDAWQSGERYLLVLDANSALCSLINFIVIFASAFTNCSLKVR